MIQSVEQFVAAARAALPKQDIRTTKTRGFGDSAEFSNILIALILSGEKTGTFALQSEFADDPGAAPAAGDYFVVTRFDGVPALLYRVTYVETLPFEQIGHDHVQVEGPNARTVDVWRKIHWGYWANILKRQGVAMTPQTPVIFQRFQLLFPQA